MGSAENTRGWSWHRKISASFSKMSLLVKIVTIATIVGALLGVPSLISYFTGPTKENQIQILGKQDDLIKDVETIKRQTAPITSVPSKPQVKVIFTNSPLLTVHRRHRITAEITSFSNYLVAIGFEVPKEIPPIGTSPGRGLTSAFSSEGDPVMNQNIYLGEEQIDDPRIWIRAYATYVFSELLGAYSVPDDEMHVWTAWIFIDYFTSSYSNQRPQESKGMNGWGSALWDIRRSCGREFMDRSLYYASRSKVMKGSDFNKYFLNRLVVGMSVIDNNFSNAPKVQEILKERHLL
jgi:hypothetical protein